MAEKHALVLYEMLKIGRGLVWSVSTELAIVMRGVSVEWSVGRSVAGDVQVSVLKSSY